MSKRELSEVEICDLYITSSGEGIVEKASNPARVHVYGRAYYRPG